MLYNIYFALDDMTPNKQLTGPHRECSSIFEEKEA